MHTIDFPSSYSSIPDPADLATLSQTTEIERSFLVNVAQHEFTGVGEIVDFGTFLGGSTYLLGMGLERNKRLSHAEKIARIHAFGMFGEDNAKRIFDADLVTQILGGPIKEDICVFEKVVDRYRSLINLYAGDICEIEWIGRPIEIGHIDIAKTLEVWKRTWAIIARHYIPGSTILIHQDFKSITLPWLTYGLELILPYVRVIRQIADGSLYFKIVDPIPDDLQTKIVTDDFTLEERIERIERMEASLEQQCTVIGRQFPDATIGKTAFCQYWFGDREEARRILEPYKARHAKFFRHFFERD
ncbi:hypothetical protein HFP57_05820 [Parasphingopyxis algicola]|uniref:hypothetical protein n=1 Tax=Parasphingopyxis algicola TaxID=2026624 RepID=UPI0015A14948|nr:hypothetical protein [Parasphingopyxis algicola]QLC24591.1 hypothetical protein HFP57_05820 [Parasphingopyxis algicola]